MNYAYVDLGARLGGGDKYTPESKIFDIEEDKPTLTRAEKRNFMRYLIKKKNMSKAEAKKEVNNYAKMRKYFSNLDIR